jgi:predicted DNA-binding transcriptional regulator YafY
MTINLDKLSRQERLKQIIQDVKEGKGFSAFDLAVRFDVSLNVIYRDISALREGTYIPSDWKFEKRVPFMSMQEGLERGLGIDHE